MNKLAEGAAETQPSLRIYLWPHRLLLLGPAFETGLHRHHAAQFCFGVDGPLRLRTAASAPWSAHRAFFVPPDRSHEFVATATSTAVIYVAAESTELATLQATIGWREDITPFPCNPRVLAQVRHLTAVGGSAHEAQTLCLALLGLQESQGDQAAFDPRITRCLSTIRTHLDRPLRLRELAKTLGVSQSWLAHRFSEAIGVPIRRYILWQRLWRAMEAALRGGTLTQAAHRAGFSDSAHLSRTFRQTFGVTPSFLFEHRARLAVCFGDGEPSPA
ncbi:MAG TPA: AraC family transcriptional regulator [Steroidobacteraceae bacterium]|nr:AraC family transcriptional regulator [Steroidobacteraceae bacterium]